MIRWKRETFKIIITINALDLHIYVQGTCVVITTGSDACCNSEKQNWTNYKKLFSRKAHNKAQQ